MVLALLGALAPMSALGAQSTVQVLASGDSAGLDAPPGPSCPDPAFETTATFDPLGNPSAEPRFGDGIGLVTSFSVPGISMEPGVVHFDEVITHDGYATRPDAVPQASERVHFELLLDGVVVGSTAPTPDLADGSRSVWMATSLGTVAVPDGADGLRIVHVGDGASPNSLIVTALCLRSEPSLSTLPVVEPASETPALPADVAPGAEPEAPTGDGSAITIENDSGDGTADSIARPSGPESEVLPHTELPRLALTGPTSPALTNLAALLLGVGLALVLAARVRGTAAGRS